MEICVSLVSVITLSYHIFFRLKRVIFKNKKDVLISPASKKTGQGKKNSIKWLITSKGEKNEKHW